MEKELQQGAPALSPVPSSSRQQGPRRRGRHPPEPGRSQDRPHSLWATSAPVPPLRSLRPPSAPGAQLRGSSAAEPSRAFTSQSSFLGLLASPASRVSCFRGRNLEAQRLQCNSLLVTSAQIRAAAERGSSGSESPRAHHHLVHRRKGEEGPAEVEPDNRSSPGRESFLRTPGAHLNIKWVEKELTGSYPSAETTPSHSCRRCTSICLAKGGSL